MKLSRTQGIALAFAVAAPLGLVPAAPALAGPADGADKRLQQEIEQYEENQRTPAWQKIPDCCEVERPWGYADLILGITFVAGLIVLW